MARKSTKQKTKKKTSKKNTTKHGRPPGSPNADAPTVRKELPRCEDCGSTKLKVLRKSEMPYHGEREGKRYTSIIRQRVQCSVCKKVHMLVSYPYDPEKWVGGEPEAPWG